jgi:hypothetical protein
MTAVGVRPPLSPGLMAKSAPKRGGKADSTASFGWRSLPACRLAGIRRLRARGFFLRLLSRLAVVGRSIAIMIVRHRLLIAAACILTVSLW